MSRNGFYVYDNVKVAAVRGPKLTTVRDNFYLGGEDYTDTTMGKTDAKRQSIKTISFDQLAEVSGYLELERGVACLRSPLPRP